jgi:hypothetical protein
VDIADDRRCAADATPLAGFSNVLREMDLPKSSLALSLFSFNAGVEIGQITFVLLVFPLVQDLVSSGWKPPQTGGIDRRGLPRGLLVCAARVPGVTVGRHQNIIYGML